MPYNLYATYQNQQPLTWEVFSRLMDDISACLKYAETKERKKLAACQVAIAFGCYNGPTSSALRQLRWQDLFRNTYNFYDENRSCVVIDRKLEMLARKNYRLSDARNPEQYVLCNQFRPDQPIHAIQFNTILQEIFQKFGVACCEPTSLTLRKTFTCKVYHDLARGEVALQVLSRELGVSMSVMRAYVGNC